MKNSIFIVFCLFAFACQDKNKKTNSGQFGEKGSEIPILSEKLCFLGLLGNTEINGEKIQDSLVLQLEIHGNVVTGTYNWAPSEKDSRRGNISAEKRGNIIQGTYDFSQEGTEQAQPIRVILHENFAEVFTNPDEAGEMKAKIEKVDCQ